MQNLKDISEIFIIYLPHHWCEDTIINKRPIMGILAFQNICSIMLALQMSILDQLSSSLPILSPIVGMAFVLGGYFMAAKKNKELAEKNKEFAQIISKETSRREEEDYKHREELERKDKEIAIRDKEIYELRKENLMLRGVSTHSNNSP